MKMNTETIKAKVDLYHVIKKLLSTGIIEVTFTKKDGTERVMKCTTKSSNIPEEKQPIGEETSKENTEIVRVYDVEHDGWRSFRVDSVTSFSLN